MSLLHTARGPVAISRAGDAGSWLLLLHGLASDRRQWRPQLHAFGGLRRVVACDLRGHGETPAGPRADGFTASPAAGRTAAIAPDPPVWSIDDLVDDAIALLDALDAERADVVGLSLGGLIALGLADRYPSRVTSLTLADTTARYPDAARAAWEARIRTTVEQGLAPLLAPTLERWFAPGLAAARPDVHAAAAAAFAGTSIAGYCGCAAALRDADLTAALARRRGPTLVIVGADDTATPPAWAEALAAAIQGSRLEVIDGAGHLSNLEQPAAFNEALDRFLPH